ncbi:MAG: alanine--glyoxylate aminotransferase family protein [Thermoanaerobaculia bacterium]|nr:alanine--glyoxylate aminotransferase family protein [Thermoanaerobaculia bacterium]
MTEPCRYFVPGPVWVRPEIRRALDAPMIGHRSGEFKDLFVSITEKLRRLFHTEQHVFVATSSGTGLMEGALLNTVPRSVLVTTVGAFSERWEAIASHVGLEVDHLHHEWGKSVDEGALADRFIGRRHHYDAVTFTHNETSTGLINNLPLLSQITRGRSNDTLVLVDAVSSLGSTPVRFDEWGLDVCLASTQKGLGLPPGLTVFAVSERAMHCAKKKSYRGTYFDFLEYERNARERQSTPFTPSLPLFYALDMQLDYILDQETLQRRWSRHVEMRELTEKRCSPFARRMVDPSHASPSVSAFEPLHRPAADIIASMRDNGFVIGNGYGEWKDRTFRIGHMGDVSVADLRSMLDTLEKIAE